MKDQLIDLLIIIVVTISIVLGVVLLTSKANAMSSGELLAGVNQVRASKGASPLVYNGQLTGSAQAKAQDMCQKNYWEHGNWISFINASGYPYYKASENLAHGFSSAQATITGWINSPSHYANMIDPVLKDTGFGILSCPGYQGRSQDTIVVEHFGSPNGTPAYIPPPTKPTPVPMPIVKVPEIKQVKPVEKPVAIPVKEDTSFRDWLISAITIQKPFYLRIKK